MKNNIEKNMDNTFKVNDTQINFDVLNALNLHHPHLGETYSNFGWNPLGENFSLDIPFIEKYLESAKYKPEVKAPSFLEQDPKRVLEAFKTAGKHNKEMIDALKSKLEKGEFKDFKGADITPQVKDILFFLECRQKMLEISTAQLGSKKIDALKAYKNINSINRKLSQLLEEAYLKEFQKNVALGNMILEAQLQNKMQSQRKEHTYSDTFMNVLKNSNLFKENQVFAPVQQKNPAFMQKVVDSIKDFSQRVQDVTQNFTGFQAQTKTADNLPNIDRTPTTPDKTPNIDRTPTTPDKTPNIDRTPNTNNQKYNTKSEQKSKTHTF